MTVFGFPQIKWDEVGIEMPNELLTTIVLSWNRPRLLNMTLRSYFETTKAPHQVMVVDNASGPETLEVIQAWNATGNIDKVILLDQNEGGCALNHAFPFVTGSYVHFSENDLEYRPGWDTSLLPKFDAFPRLGQLSLFAPEPERDKGEVWTHIGLKDGGRRPCHLGHEAQRNYHLHCAAYGSGRGSLDEYREARRVAAAK